MTTKFIDKKAKVENPMSRADDLFIYEDLPAFVKKRRTVLDTPRYSHI